LDSAGGASMNALRVSAVAALLTSGTALAYPHFQLAGNAANCASCHFAPAGGGLLTEFGQEQSVEPLSGGGNGAFLHGLVPLPRWLSVGGDFRLAGLLNDAGPEGMTRSVFPMQADLAVRVGTERLSAIAVGGVWRSVRTRGGSDFFPGNLLSREHYLLWRPGGSDMYVRAGRFFPPYGLRLADHTSYIRRFLGTNLFEEPYGASVGYVTDPWEVHGTAFLSTNGEGSGGAVMAETRLGDAVIGGSARASFDSATDQYRLGPYGKYWWEDTRLMFMGELDGVRQTFSGADGRWQLVAYAGPIWMPLRGLSVGLAYQLFMEDLRVSGVDRHAADAWVSYLPWAHVEIMLSGRGQQIGSDDSAWTGMLQLHYFL
jgi:hypothetical protein